MTPLQKLIHRAAVDPDFRTRLSVDVRAATAELGVELDDETVAVLTEMGAQRTPLQAAGEGPDPDWIGSPSFTRAAAAGPDPDWIGSPSFTRAAL